MEEWKAEKTSLKCWYFNSYIYHQDQWFWVINLLHNMMPKNRFKFTACLPQIGLKWPVIMRSGCVILFDRALPINDDKVNTCLLYSMSSHV